MADEDAVVEPIPETIILSAYPLFYDEAIGSEAANTLPTHIHDNDAVGVGWVLEGQPEDEVDTYLQLTNDLGQTTEWIRDASGLNWVRYKTTETWERLTFQTPVDSPVGWASSETYNVTIGVGVSVQLQISGGLGIGGSGSNDAWTWEPSAAVALQLAAEGSLTAGQTPRYDPFDSGEDDGKTLSQKREQENEEKVWKSIPIVKRTRVIEQRIFDPNLSNLTPLGLPTAEVLDALGEPLVTSERVASARKEGTSIDIVAEWYGLSGSVSAQIWSKVVPQSP